MAGMGTPLRKTWVVGDSRGLSPSKFVVNGSLDEHQILCLIGDTVPGVLSLTVYCLYHDGTRLPLSVDSSHRCDSSKLMASIAVISTVEMQCQLWVFWGR